MKLTTANEIKLPQAEKELDYAKLFSCRSGGRRNKAARAIYPLEALKNRA